MRLSIALLFACGSALPTWACGDDGVRPPAEAELSILFVGNSLTMWNDLPGMVTALLDSVGAGPAFTSDASIPGTGLEDHWLGGPARERIREGPRDWVVLQQGPSATEGRPSLLEYSERFSAEIRAAGARPALYMVWPSEARSFDFDGVSDSYREAARRSGGTLLPAGDAWRSAWAIDPELELYGADRFHPSELGSHAAALTIAAALSGRAPSAFPHRFRTPAGRTIDFGDGVAATVTAAAAAALSR